ncbi:hypothetical protein [Endozoicomonas lisbonensis]|uniref:hypothetical protein n=1 Tax=Endozoicomonas lisbonensis TaxID=3120522 RepID=UPI0033997374
MIGVKSTEILPRTKIKKYSGSGEGDGFFIGKWDSYNKFRAVWEHHEHLLEFGATADHGPWPNDTVYRQILRTLITWSYGISGNDRWLTADDIRRSFCSNDKHGLIPSCAGKLNTLVKKGIAIKSGRGKGARYRISPDYQENIKSSSYLINLAPANEAVQLARQRVLSKRNQ